MSTISDDNLTAVERAWLDLSLGLVDGWAGEPPAGAGGRYREGFERGAADRVAGRSPFRRKPQ